jgi:hypothetical protein
LDSENRHPWRSKRECKSRGKTASSSG